MASVGHVGHIELRDLDDDDLDAIFEMMRDRTAVEMAAFTAADPDDRDAFDAWIARERAAPEVATYVVTENGGFAGTAALFSVEGDREVTYWIARHAWGRGVATEALRILVSREAGATPVRPRRRAQRGLARCSHQGRVHRGLARLRFRSGCRTGGRGDRAGAGAGAGVARLGPTETPRA